jgi:hypothetical protein
MVAGAIAAAPELPEGTVDAPAVAADPPALGALEAGGDPFALQAIPTTASATSNTTTFEARRSSIRTVWKDAGLSTCQLLSKHKKAKRQRQNPSVAGGEKSRSLRNTSATTRKSANSGTAPFDRKSLTTRFSERSIEPAPQLG